MICFWLHYKISFYLFLTPWHVFDVMTCFWLHDKLFDIMTNVWTSWRFLTLWRTFWSNDDLFDIMTYVAIIYVMTNVLTPWNILTTWHTFWRPDALFDVMFFFTLWQTLCHHDVFLSIIREQNIMKMWFQYYKENLMTNFLNHDIFLTLW